MKIGVVSDLHLDSHIWSQELGQGDVLINAGDMLPAAILGYPNTNRHWTDLPARVFAFYDHAFANFKDVIFVAGNHENDHGLFPYTHDILRRELQDRYPRLHILDNEMLEIDGQWFYGGTGWTDFNGGSPKAKRMAYGYMTDYKWIRTIDADGLNRPLLPDDTEEKHYEWSVGLAAARSYLRDIHGGSKPLIVVTHHVPSQKSSNILKFGTGPENYGFYSHLDHLMGPDIPLWIHGHTHDSYDYHIGDTRIVCNPHGGFYKVGNNKQFIPNLIIEV